MPATILILAGRRGGAVDPLAVGHGVADKCLVPVYGLPMLAHVLHAALASDADLILISVHEPAVEQQLLPLLAAGAAARIRFVPAADNLTDSVLTAVRGRAFPLLITTADACLLSADSMAELEAGALAADAQAAVGLARRDDVLRAHPDGQRRFYGFSDVAVSNCNAYWIGNAAALRAAEAFRGGGQFVKKPIRIARAFGIINLLRFRFGLGPIHVVFERLGRHMQLRLAPVLLSDGAAAIDVDHARSLAVTEAVMAERNCNGMAAPAA
jgi:GTP:adenosylcobinamide-phosphate guanylyltransferase